MSKKNIIIIVLSLIIITGLAYYGLNQTGRDDLTEENELIEENVQNESNINDFTEEDIEKFLQLEIGEKAPDFTLETLDGKKVSLSDYKGKTVFINFWATWCPYCVKEMPDLNKLYNENKDKDFVVLAVDVGESSNDVKKFVEEHGYDFPILLDKDGKVAMTYLVVGIPTTYVVDKEGIIRDIKIQMLTYPEMKEILEYVRDSE